MDFPKKDWNWINTYYLELLNDIYPQPDEEGRIEITKLILSKFIPLLSDVRSVLDVGCGEGFLEDMTTEAMIYLGITLSNEDYEKAMAKGRDVIFGDFNFLKFGRFPNEKTFDLVFASHALEHSPFPLITLMEWHRVSNKYLLLISPNPEHYTYTGRNHYSVYDKHHLRWLLRRAGWKVIDKHHTDTDLSYLCEKKDRLGYEGWAEVPLSRDIHDEERDDP